MIGLPLVDPTQTYYSFTFSGVQLNVTFTTPILGSDVQTWIQTPVTYITLSVKTLPPADVSTVSLYFAMTAELVVAEVSESVQWQRDTTSIPGADLLRFVLLLSEKIDC